MKTYYNVIVIADDGYVELYETDIPTVELARAHLTILHDKYNRNIFSGHEDYTYFKIEKIISEIILC
jgi:hypothetical protein